MELLRFLAPGTPIRDALENIMRARTGGLLVFTDSRDLDPVVSGGIPLDIEMTPELLYELAKMDGAIILNEAGDRVRLANAQLVPDPRIFSAETGIRHRSAERLARQTGALVIAISQRRELITLYKGSLRYRLRDQATVLSRANQALHTLERYRNMLAESLDHLSALELQDLATLNDVITVIRRIEIALRVGDEIGFYVDELGAEGRLIRLQRDELLVDVAPVELLLVRDYLHEKSELSPLEVVRQIRALPTDHIQPSEIARALSYTITSNIMELSVVPRGFRLLSKVPRLPANVAEKVVARFKNIKGIMSATMEQLDEVEGVGKVRARTIIDSLKRYQEQMLIKRV